MTNNTINFDAALKAAKVAVEKVKKDAVDYMEDYIREKGEGARAVELAELTGFSTQRVTRMILDSGRFSSCRKLLTERYIKLDENDKPIPGEIKEISYYVTVYC